MRAVTLLCVFPVKFLRLPSDASHDRKGRRSKVRPPYRLVTASATIPAREICLPRRSGARPFSRWQTDYTKKSDPRTGKPGKKQFLPDRPRPQARPGSLSRVSA